MGKGGLFSRPPHKETTNDPSPGSWQLQMWCAVIKLQFFMNLQPPHPLQLPEVASVALLPSASPVVLLTLNLRALRTRERHVQVSCCSGLGAQD